MKIFHGDPLIRRFVEIIGRVVETSIQILHFTGPAISYIVFLENSYRSCACWILQFQPLTHATVLSMGRFQSSL